MEPKDLVASIKQQNKYALNIIHKQEVTSIVEHGMHNSRVLRPEEHHSFLVLMERGNGFAVDLDLSSDGERCDVTLYTTTEVYDLDDDKIGEKGYRVVSSSYNHPYLGEVDLASLILRTIKEEYLHQIEWAKYNLEMFKE